LTRIQAIEDIMIGDILMMIITRDTGNIPHGGTQSILILILQLKEHLMIVIGGGMVIKINLGERIEGIGTMENGYP